MTTKEIANQLVTRLRAFDYETLYADMFSADARNVEGMQMGPDRPQVTLGLEAMSAKGKQWADTFETTAQEVSDPLVNGDQFIVHMSITTKNRHTDEVKSEAEYILYTVEN